VQRRVSSHRVLVVARQRIHVGIVQSGHTLTAEAVDGTWRIHEDNRPVSLAMEKSPAVASESPHLAGGVLISP
jgi:hypothetical protein